MHRHRDMLYSERLYAAPFVGLRPERRHRVRQPLLPCLSARLHHLLCAEGRRDRRAQCRAQHAGAHVPVDSRAPRAPCSSACRRSTPGCCRRPSRASRSTSPACASACPPPSRCPRTFTAVGEIDSASRSWTASARTEATHVFISNQAGAVRPGSSGRAVPGYRIRLVDEHGVDVPQGEIGDLLVSGGSVFAGYWNRRDATAASTWRASGITPATDTASTPMATTGTWGAPTTCCASVDTGCSPAEVEAALIGHPDVRRGGGGRPPG